MAAKDNDVRVVDYVTEWEDGVVTTAAKVNLRTGVVFDVEVSDEGAEFSGLVREYIEPLDANVSAEVELQPNDEYRVVSRDALANLQQHFGFDPELPKVQTAGNWSPYEALAQCCAALPDAAFARSYDIDPMLIHSVSEMMEDVESGNELEDSVDVVALLLRARAAIPKAWPGELPVELCERVDATIGEHVRSRVEGCDFFDLAQDRYTVALVSSAVVLALPVTEFRPEAMRVSERVAKNGNSWFEVEAYSTNQKGWLEFKSHDSEAKAVADAKGWYPEQSVELHSAKWYDKVFEADALTVPARIRQASEEICREFNIRGTSDPMYIANVIGHDLGVGDGRGKFSPIERMPTEDAIESIGKRLASSYSGNGVVASDVSRIVKTNLQMAVQDHLFGVAGAISKMQTAPLSLLDSFSPSSTGGGFVGLFREHHFGGVQVMVTNAADETKIAQPGDSVSIGFYNADTGVPVGRHIDSISWSEAGAAIEKQLNEIRVIQTEGRFTDAELLVSLPNSTMRLNTETKMVEVVGKDGQVTSFGGEPAIVDFATENNLEKKDVDRLLALDSLGSKMGKMSGVGVEIPVAQAGRFIGPVLATKDGAALQDSGRGKLVAHDLSKFETPPKVGDKLDVNYLDGVAKVAKELSQDTHAVAVAMHVR